VPRQVHRLIKALSVSLAAGTIFSMLTCVRTVADTVGTGLGLGGATGMLGPASPGVATAGAGHDLFADTVRFTPIGR